MSITFTSMNTLRIAAHLITGLDLKVSFFFSLSKQTQFIQPGTEFLYHQKKTTRYLISALLGSNFKYLWGKKSFQADVLTAFWAARLYFLPYCFSFSFTAAKPCFHDIYSSLATCHFSLQPLHPGKKEPLAPRSSHSGGKAAWPWALLPSWTESFVSPGLKWFDRQEQLSSLSNCRKNERSQAAQPQMPRWGKGQHWHRIQHCNSWMAAAVTPALSGGSFLT